ncbi:hypothetical protein BAE44_0022437 [Dichanthelium oligosanthes]|uniref:Uncharacterized protein n=1 Tax=Dichanthelium oligosanthes TaxID=888268 RepID=A0A1E5UUK1_9POAL|nr:hypothetical protein BAE44_0022437 [Dichanthelium oligosanthes]
MFTPSGVLGTAFPHSLFRRLMSPMALKADPTSTRGERQPLRPLISALDAFLKGSIVYVCFESQAVLTPAVAEALAEALERSGVPFLWVVSAGNSGIVSEGFEAHAAAAVVGWWCVGGRRNWRRCGTPRWGGS